MEVILLEKVGNLGDIGDKVNVKPGFGRNFLVPQGKAAFATEENLAELEKRRAELEAAAQEKLKEAQARAEQLTALDDITITAQAGEEGKLFGSIGTKDIADSVSQQGVEVTKSEIKLPEGTLRELGEYSIDIQLHAEVITAVNVVIVAE